MRSLYLSGSESASLALIQASGLVGSEEQQKELCVRYGCNPLAIKIVRHCSSSLQTQVIGGTRIFVLAKSY